jgi:hypothetical protein
MARRGVACWLAEPSSRVQAIATRWASGRRLALAHDAIADDENAEGHRGDVGVMHGQL